MADNNPPFELGLYSQQIDDLSARLEEIKKLYQQADQFDSLSVSLRLEIKQLNGTILDSPNPDGLIAQLDKIEKSWRLNNASAEALSERLKSREVYLHQRVPLTLRAFQSLRDFVSFSVLESCRGQIRALIAEGYHVEDSLIDTLAVVMPAFVAISQIKLPSVGWVAAQPLDEKPIYWSNLTRPYTAEELAQMRAGKVKAIIEAATALVSAARLLIVAAGPYAQACPAFRCEPEPEPEPAQADPRILEWNQPLGGSDEEWLKEICKQGGRAYPPTNPTDIEILNQMLENRRVKFRAQPMADAGMIGDTTL